MHLRNVSVIWLQNFLKSFLIHTISLQNLKFLSRFFNSRTEENPTEVSKTIECAVKNCSDSFHKQHLFSSLHRIFNLFWTVQPSVCRSERFFSRLKMLKNYLRNRMSQKLLQYLMLLSGEKEFCHGFDLNIIVNKWIKKKRHRISL